ncbi:hypothetical protein HYC85_031650 [Camellia sinensis]|uniref:Thymidine kinase n=1 Tax=Camellia sinensis TaxID=4442 RepID=A0A7J7FRS9_CAMSI|nr:hypothetical protein HYC85_031650 [Camellia sinensis]
MISDPKHLNPLLISQIEEPTGHRCWTNGMDMVESAMLKSDCKLCLLDVIGIDEAQFFDDLYDFCCKVADCDGKIVIVAGLDGDYLRWTFGSVLHIIPLADSITKLTARCQLCGKRAFFTLRKTNETKTELIGGSDVYMPVCRQHYVNGQVVIESAWDTLESCSKAQTDSYQEEVAVA